MDETMTMDGPVSPKQSLFAQLGLASTRSPQAGALKLPSDWRVVSADDHCEITEDIFYENFPASMKDKAPRVRFDKVWRLEFLSPDLRLGYSEPVAKMVDAVCVRDCFDFSVRNAHMDAEGVHSEIAFPQSLMGFLRHPDLEVREMIHRVYNEYLADMGAKNPGRFYGVGVFGNWWDPARAEASMQQIVDLGLKTFMIPTTMKNPDGREVSLASNQMNTFWEVVESAGLPLSLHIGEGLTMDGPGEPGMFPTFVMSQMSPFRKPLAQLIFGGVFDRHPNLAVVFAEAGINWVAGLLQDAEFYFDVWKGLAGYETKLSPTEYWMNNCYATFQLDRIGLELLPYIGADRVMWAMDYPHSEGVFGASAAAMQKVISSTSEQEARAILGGTATRLFKL